MDKRIEYSIEDQDYSLFLAGRYIGSAPTLSEARARLDEAAYREASHPLPEAQ